VLSCSTALGLCVWAALANRNGWLRQSYQRYHDSLARELRTQFIELPPVRIIFGQLLAILACAGATLATHEPGWSLLVPLLAVAPRVLIERMRRRRVAAIERKLDGFVLALANALRASPSAGRALAMIQPVTPAPLDRELDLVLREMRVGSTLEQALSNLSARVRSFQLDAALSGLLIGRRTGGNVPTILDGAAQTLREMARLQGVLRARTAEGRAQANVLTAFPIALVFIFDLVRPGYFKPLTDSVLGITLMLVAIALWVSSVLMLRRIMAVTL